MNLDAITNPELVIVIGLEEPEEQSFCELFFDIGGKYTPVEKIPDENARFVAFYKKKFMPDVVISHIGIVNEISRFEDDEDTYPGVTFYFKAIIRLDHYPIPRHPEKPYEKWNIKEFNLSKSMLGFIDELVGGKTN